MMMPVFMKWSPLVLDGSVTRRISFVHHLIILFFGYADKYREFPGFVGVTLWLQLLTQMV
jgi:hypothetical protein